MSLSTNAATSEPLVRYARKLSHDLNNFSTVVRTYGELLLSDLDPDSAPYADVAEIHKAAENMVQYLQRVTRFSRAASMKRAAVDVDAVARDAAAAFASALDATGSGRAVTVRALSGGVVAADAIWLRDALLELLQNAHEASPADRPVVLSTARVGDQVVVVVSDEGPGFDATIVESAAEPLVTTKAGVRGAGMGLAIVAAFAGALNGTLSQSHQDGRTDVTLTLPATADDA